MAGLGVELDVIIIKDTLRCGTKATERTIRVGAQFVGQVEDLEFDLGEGGRRCGHHGR